MFLMSLRMMGKTTSRWAALIGNAQRSAFCVEEAVTKLAFVRPAQGGDGERELKHSHPQSLQQLDRRLEKNSPSFQQWRNGSWITRSHMLL